MDVRTLMKQMTRKEKIGQMLQLAPFLFVKELYVEVAGHIDRMDIEKEKVFLAGSVLGIKSAEEMIRLQETYLEQSRLKIPLMFMADIIHGYKTIFPVPIALSCSWQPDLAKKVAEISATEASTAGLHVTFSPMSDLVRDPRWGRVVESFGEDPHLNYQFSYAMVKGYQKDDLKHDESLISCVKHFAAYGLSEAGRDYNTTDVSRPMFHQFFTSGYKGAIDAGAKMIMTGFNVFDMIPATVNSYLLRDLLRDLWQFDGVTISDYDSLYQVIAHGCAKDNEEAAIQGIQAGLDIAMASMSYSDHLESLIERGVVEEKLLDEAVYRILKLKDDVGLFDHPFKGASLEREDNLVRSDDHLMTAKTIADECAVLLKNDDQILPLKPGTKIALIGPYARSKNTNGPWSWLGENALNQALDDALRSVGLDVVYVDDRDILDTTDQTLVETIASCDKVILALGEKTEESGEAHSRSIIDIPGNQKHLVENIRPINDQIIVLLYNGRPLILEPILQAKAILETWFLGSMGNEAIADLLIGKTNPSGKLTMSFPKNGGQIPIYYNYLNTGRPKIEGIRNDFVSYYLDVDNAPQFPFGFGLSYATFVYENMQLSKTSMTPNESIKVFIDVTNTSDLEGFETIQLYIRDHVGKTSRPVKELKDFKKLWFTGNEKKTIQFTIDLLKLSYRDATGKDTFEPGKFSVLIGRDSVDLIALDFELVAS